MNQSVKSNSLSTTYHILPTIYQRGFTIVELLVVIVVIGILAAVTIVSYTGIAQKAKIASMQSDLSSAAQQLKLFQAADPNNYYPATIDCTIPDSTTNKCVKASGSNSFIGGYTFNNSAVPRTFTLVVTNGGTISYNITNDSAPVAGVPPLVCPAGFIVVPGSVTYSTSDFCVMKYEAKNDGSNNAISQAAGTPWVDITQPASVAAGTAACSGCHLITEAEWMTIAQNVLGVASNWDNGSGGHTVGTGYIYKGNSDATGSSIASSDDNNGYFNTSNVAPSNQRRTLTLSNGQVIWDFSGNAWEWTSGTVQSPIVQPGINGGGYNVREYNTLTNQGTLPVNPMPASTGIAGASTWTSSTGIGTIFSSSDSTTARGFARGGSTINDGGILMLSLQFDPAGGFTNGWYGFRVSK